MNYPARYLRRGLCVLAILSVATGIRATVLDGEWSFNMSAAEGEHTFSVTPGVEGETVTGTSGDETFTGTFTDNQLVLSGDHYIDEAGYAAPLSLSGTLDADQITGTATWDSYDAALVGRRVVAD